MTGEDVDPTLDPEQLHGVGDMDPETFRVHGRTVVDWIADYLAGVGDLPVLSRVAPGDVRAALPAVPPAAPEPFADVLADLDRVVVPGTTHWNHPAFHAYFAITGSGPGILGEAVAAALNVNGMLWRTSPAATELEEVVLDWLRQLLGLPGPEDPGGGFRGIILDTASVATLTALAGAREAAGLDVRVRGMAGRGDLPPLRVYTSTQAHSSVAKAAITLGLGQDGVRSVATDAAFRLDVAALEDAIRADVQLGVRPLAIVATVGTTSSTSVDPVAEVADLRERLVEELGHPIWLHVDGAYGGMVALCEELRWVLDGVERADSFVTNPHKWLFTPIDCSALYVRDPGVLKAAFSLVPEYLTTDDPDAVTDYMDWGVQLGRRFRALKLWMVLRWFGADGLARRIRHHVAQARHVADWVDAHPRLERLAPVPMSTVCFRDVGDVGAGTGAGAGVDEAVLRERNLAWMRRVNATGEVFLSHTELDGRTCLRLATGNLRTDDARLERTLGVLERCLAPADRSTPAD
ncbi:MAG: pyridoxal phosphate-dependent decarboxylase family protein [Actinomycetes bacterium]